MTCSGRDLPGSRQTSLSLKRLKHKRYHDGKKPRCFGSAVCATMHGQAVEVEGSQRRACSCRRQEVPFPGEGCDVASKGMPLLSLLDTARMVRFRHAVLCSAMECVNSHQ